MASKQYEDKGARPKTFPSQGGGSTSTQNVSEHQCNSQESVLESDVVPDAIPVFLDIVDVVVIYSKEDYEVASDKFIPWLKDRAMGINEPDARIYLYDDISVDINLFRKTEDMATRCMKILVYITEHFMANTELKSIVEELIFLTRFGNAEEAKQHISNIYKLGSDIGIETNPLDSLTECVLQQKKSALMPVQTTEKKIGFTGLLAIHPIIQFFAVEQNKKCKENMASNVIRAAINDRRKYQQGQQNATCQHQRQQNLQASYHSHMLHVSQMERNPQPCRSTRHEHMTDFGNQHSTSDQFILENQVTNEAVSFDSTVGFPSPTSQPMNSQVVSSKFNW
ncbi:uncharacterized protein [Argopecten irradians]|uniref:uncharacterized protein n=1 Tax=Argopecten irradians TaxID=31199 RepID=UPI003712C9F4